MRVTSVCVCVCLCVCVCVRLLLLNRYLDFDGNCRKLTVIIRSNYCAYFDVPVRWEVPVRGRKRGRIGDFSDFSATRDCSQLIISLARFIDLEIQYARDRATGGYIALARCVI